MNKREEIEKQLNENIPREVVSQRSAGGNRSLSYLETWYVIDRLNRVFGNLGWDSETVELRLVNNEPARYVAKVRLTVSAPVFDANGSLEGFRNVIKEGTGWGSDKPRKDGSIDSPHEMAVKEAESDALKRAAMKLGISMGLGLYDKSGEFVDETPQQTAAKAPSAAPQVGAASGQAAPTTSNRDILNKMITETSAVIIRKKMKTVTELKSLMKDKFGVDSKDQLNDTQARELIKQLEVIANG